MTSSRGIHATVLVVVGIVAGMTGLSFAAVPLYRLFCQATGYGGTTQRAEALPGRVAAGTITVRFDTSTAPDLGWEFRPLQREVVVHPGEEKIVAFRAVNKTPRPITGTATFNVTPLKTGIYFNKIQCFCFTEQHLDPGESVDMPVSFFVDPAILDDPNTSDVTTITLSYTMFHAKDDGRTASPAGKPVAARASDAPPSRVN
jgi:cytochrome c oxidase assembly protein subunit 11